MKTRADRLLVSDEELANAAIDFIIADLIKRSAKNARSRFFQDEDHKCLLQRTNNDEDQQPCWRLYRDGGLDWGDFCESCVEKAKLYTELKQAAAKSNGKLRRLRNLVKKRREANELEDALGLRSE